MRRRDCIKCLASTLGLPFLMAASADSSAPRLTPPEEIERQVTKARPLLGGTIPADLKDRLGATHYDGKYYRTRRPYLLEGCEALLGLGMRVAKLFFGNQLPGYGYNSDWKLSAESRLIDVAKHPYFVQAFAMPFTTFVLEIQPVAGGGKGFSDPHWAFADDEAQFYELAEHLLKTYRHRAVTFILQHWEGDWMLRGNFKETWEPGQNRYAEGAQPPDFVRWLAARQRGVERARAEAGASQCRVYHAAEVNRVWDSTRGIPTLTTHVLPHVAVDLVSWSSYDGMASPVKAWQGLEIIRHYMRPSFPCSASRYDKWSTLARSASRSKARAKNRLCRGGTRRWAYSLLRRFPGFCTGSYIATRWRTKAPRNRMSTGPRIFAVSGSFAQTAA